MKRNRLNLLPMIILILFLIPSACNLPGRQETTPVPVLPVTKPSPAVTASETPAVPPPEKTPADSVVSGSILIEDGRSAMGGYAGDTIQASVTYTATSRVASVTEMRTVRGCWARTLQDAAWEPFVRLKSFPVHVMLNWNGFSVSVQYRDAQGNLSPAYCADINVEGMPPPLTKAPAAATPTTPTAMPPAAEQEFFKVWSIGAAINGATKPTTFSINESWLVTYILTYHWNNARGATPGTIGLRASDGTTYGPWQATGQPGQGGVPNAAWVVKPNIVIPPGAYTVLDSDPSTWAQNKETDGAGMSRGSGVRQSNP